MTDEEIEMMLKDIAKESLTFKPSELKRLGIDEIAWVKGQGNYCAVLIDLDKFKPIGILGRASGKCGIDSNVMPGPGCRSAPQLAVLPLFPTDYVA